MQNKTEKLQKVLANLGLGSRRKMEDWISDGRVSVDGQIAKLGDRVNEAAKIQVDGRLIQQDQSKCQKTRVIMYHKPLGEVCTRFDPDGRKTVFDNLPPLKQGRWIVVGRLDINTSGLLLFTNNGELANKLMHPSSQIEREYSMRVIGKVDKDVLNKLTKGVQLSDGLAKFKKLEDKGGAGANHWYNGILTEGRNREVRRLWESQNVTVNRLIRVRFGTIKLPRDLKPGRLKEVDSIVVNDFICNDL